MAQHFTAKLEPVSHGGHFVVVPPDVADAAGLKYGVRVRGTVNGAAYRSSLMKYSGTFHMGVHKATLAQAGAQPGDTVDVTIEIDDEPLPTDTIPPDLAKAFAKSARARSRFEALSPAHKREHVKHVIEAKQAETRARRIAKTIATLEAEAARAPAKKTAKSTPKKAKSSAPKKAKSSASKKAKPRR